MTPLLQEETNEWATMHHVLPKSQGLYSSPSHDASLPLCVSVEAQMLGFVFTVVSIIGITTAYPHGPPVGLAPEMCEMMAPDPGPKGHNATAQVTVSPYVVETTATEGYKGGESYKVTIAKTSTEVDDFKGFFCQVRRSSGSNADALGTFSEFSNATKAKYQDCTSVMGAFSHATPDPVPTFSATWTAPNDTTLECLAVYCTVVQTKQVYWVRVPSKVFCYIKPEDSEPSDEAEIHVDDISDDLLHLRNTDHQEHGNRQKMTKAPF
ncbi:putative defense protein 3 [Oscarella lobularis]|uniref:putative defense protein 3 n=1 Tax=Oscarella lobularis TaxID=121494 RepID=UPI0033134237